MPYTQEGSPGGSFGSNGLVSSGLISASQWAWACYESVEVALTVSEICVAQGWAMLEDVYPHVATPQLGLGDLLLLTGLVTSEQWRQVVRQMQQDPSLKMTTDRDEPVWVDLLVQNGILTWTQVGQIQQVQSYVHRHPQANAWAAMSPQIFEQVLQGTWAGDPQPKSGSLSLHELQPFYWSVQNAHLAQQEQSLHVQALLSRKGELEQQLRTLEAQVQHLQQAQQQSGVDAAQQVESLGQRLQQTEAKLAHQQEANQVLLKAHQQDLQKIANLEEQLQQTQQTQLKYQQAIHRLKAQALQNAQQAAQRIRELEQGSEVADAQLRQQLQTSRAQEQRLRDEVMMMQDQVAQLEQQVLQRGDPSSDAAQKLHQTQQDYQALQQRQQDLSQQLETLQTEHQQQRLEGELVALELEQQREQIQQLTTDLEQERQQAQMAAQKAAQKIGLYQAQITELEVQRQDLQSLRAKKVSQQPQKIAVSAKPQPMDPPLRQLHDVELELEGIPGFAQSTPWVRRVLAHLHLIDLMDLEKVRATLQTWEQRGGTFTDVLTQISGLQPETVKFFADGGVSARLMGSRTLEDYLVASGLVTRYHIEQHRDLAVDICETLAAKGILSPATARYFAQAFGALGSSPTLSLRQRAWDI